MAEQRIGHFFPGSNTAFGFVGFFDSLHARADRAVILKGGPGVGKSTLMRETGARFEKRGLDVQYFHCSGDPDSLDAVFAPSLGFLVLDGTAPHIVDPKYPGARDGILNLGVCLDEKQLTAQRDEIEALSAQIAACYAQATRYLSAALSVRRDAQAVYDAALPEASRRQFVQVLLYLLKDGPSESESHCFAQAVTWKGVLQQLDSLVTDTVYCLDLPWGVGADAFLSPLWAKAAQAGRGGAACHDPLDAGLLSHVRIGGALFTSAVLPEAPVYAPEYDAACLRREASRLAFDRAVYDLCLNQAVEALAEAKARHDSLERYYVDAMNYDRLDEIKAQFLAALS